ncbi:hypothetical protein B0H19DRAFT_1074357 [Mycena capillaripes]|nr:hypothetical protein B0H19DRAFT_1074357 [Mycena capillaripes]
MMIGYGQTPSTETEARSEDSGLRDRFWVSRFLIPIPYMRRAEGAGLSSRWTPVQYNHNVPQWRADVHGSGMHIVRPSSAHTAHVTLIARARSRIAALGDAQNVYGVLSTNFVLVEAAVSVDGSRRPAMGGGALALMSPCRARTLAFNAGIRRSDRSMTNCRRGVASD